jgi:iron complex outermembrane receptor protein
VPNIANDKQYGGSLRIDQDLGPVHAVSITSYRRIQGHWRADNDLGPSPIVQVDNYNTADYGTQEFQLSNKDPGRLTWLAGAFFYVNQVYGADPQANQGTGTAGGYRAMYGVQFTRSASVFGQATYAIFDDTKLTLGLRYTDETLTAKGRTTDINGKVVAGPFRDQFTSKPWTWRIALDHDFNENILGYVSYNRGFKSGGYNLSSPGAAPFFPETVDAYETGIKSTFLDRRVRLNVGAFYYNYKNLQVAVVPGGGSQIFTNAARARNYGLDATLDFAATRNLQLSAGLGLLHAKYRDYPDAQGFTIRGVPFPIPNAAGRNLPYAPHVTGNLGAEYDMPLQKGDLRATANVSYTSKTYVTPDEGLVRPAYTLLSSSLEYRSDSWWSIEVWGKNLLDKYYYANAVESRNGWYIVAAPPRTFGVTLKGKFPTK